MALDPITGQWLRYKVGDRVWIKTAHDAAYTISGIITKIAPPGTYKGSLEMYTIALDKPFRCKDRKGKSRTKDLRKWITDSSMCDRIPVLEDLSGIK